MVSGLDEQFGRIPQAIRKAGIDKNTIVVLTSDHGDCLGYPLCIRRGPGNQTSTYLWDRQVDPMQMNDIGGVSADIVHELVAKELLPWLKKTGGRWLE